METSLWLSGLVQVFSWLSAWNIPCLMSTTLPTSETHRADGTEANCRFKKCSNQNPNSHWLTSSDLLLDDDHPIRRKHSKDTIPSFTRALTWLPQTSIGASVEDALRGRWSLNEGLPFKRSAARSAARNPYLLSVSNTERRGRRDSGCLHARQSSMQWLPFVKHLVTQSDSQHLIGMDDISSKYYLLCQSQPRESSST